MSVGLRSMALSPILPACEPLSVAERDPSLASEQPTRPLLRPLQGSENAPGRKVVVVDDSLTVRKILEISLRREGFEVRTFEHGLAFLRWLTTSPACLPDLLLLDVMLPTLDGYSIARYLKDRPAFRHIVLVFLSSKDGVLDRLKGRLLGASGYLTKPFRTQEVIEIVWRLMTDRPLE